MPVVPPALPADAEAHLDVIGLMGLMRISMFETFGDRRFWDERFYDLFTTMLARQLQGSVSTLEEMTGAVTGVSYSTKVRMIEDARKAGVIQAVNRSDITLNRPLESTSARKVFFLSEAALAAMVRGLEEIAGDIREFAARREGADA